MTDWDRTFERTGYKRVTPECTCGPPPHTDPPRPWCDVHSTPSTAYRAGAGDALRHLADSIADEMPSVAEMLTGRAAAIENGGTI